MLEQAFAEAERARRELETAQKSGKEIIQVMCDAGTKRGDIIEIRPVDDTEEDEEETKNVRVLVTHEITGVDPETYEMHSVVYAWCVILEEGDITTEEDFAALYAEDSEEPQETLEAADEEAEPVDPNVCSCGANRAMCARNQNVFGGHLNE